MNYDIGNKLYPVKNRKNIRVFFHDNTIEIDNKGLCKWIDTHTFNPGFCYTNADLIVKGGEAVNLDVQYYAGWVFIGDHVPIHHAWAVIGDSVIDVNFRKSVIELLKTVDYSNLNWREGTAMRIKAREKRISLSADCIMGKVFPGIIYVGSQDECNLARNRYNTMIDRFPDHPSYKNRNDQHDMTELQREIYKNKF